jgi:hypothetical protein
MEYRFEGLLTYIDRPSDRAPSGSRGHRVIITRNAASGALTSLIGKPVNVREVTFDNHDKTNLKGEICEAWIDGNTVRVRGVVRNVDGTPLAPNHPRHEDLGMSYELGETRIENLRASVWRVTETNFTGAAVLYRSKAAYQETRFEICQ